MKDGSEPAILLLRRREATGGRSGADLWSAVEPVLAGIVGFPARDVGGDGAGEGEGRRRRWSRLRLGGLCPGLGGDEGDEAFPEAGGADADGAAGVGGVFLTRHLIKIDRFLAVVSQLFGAIFGSSDCRERGEEEGEEEALYDERT